MPRPPTLRHGAALAGIVLAAACSGDGGSAVDDTDVPASTPGEESALLAVVPAEDRVAVGVGEPRSPGYWVIWSSCGDGSEADTAAANGGRDAGWIILDDLLADPGMSLGGHPVSACEEGLDVLTTDSDPVRRLARQVLTAELNRNAGSESCGAADESIPVA